MLRQYLNKYTSKKPFPDSHYMSEIWERTRNKLADKLQQPELKKIPLRNLRHKFATSPMTKQKICFSLCNKWGIQNMKQHYSMLS